MLSQAGIARKTYWIVTILISIAILLLGIHYVKERQENLLQKKQLQMLQIAVELERSINSDELKRRIQQAQAHQITEQEKALQINAWLQPALMGLQQQYPGFGMGVYIKQIGRIVAIGPTFHPEMLVPLNQSVNAAFLDTGKPILVRTDKSIGFFGKPVLHVNYPILYGDEVIGHTWASAKIEDINAENISAIATVLGYGLGFWLAILLALWLVFNRLEVTLETFARQIKQKDDNRQPLAAFPALMPVLDTVIELRESLKDEYARRAKRDREQAHFLSMTQDLLFVTDMEFNCVEINPAVTRTLGYTLEDFNTHPLLSLIHPDDRALTAATRKKVQQAYSMTNYENRYLTKAGQYRWLSWTITVDAEANLIFSVARDVTEQKENEQKLLDLAAIVENSHDAIISTTRVGAIRSWNKGAQDMFGYSETEAVGHHFGFLTLPECIDDTEAVLNQIQRGEKILNHSAVLQRKDGTQVTVSMTITTILDRTGCTLGLAAILRDITPEKRLEQERLRLDRLSTISQMAAGISHEVRNPMTTVRGFLQLLGKKDEYARDKQFFDLMIEELDRANTIISEYLAMSQNKVSHFDIIKLASIIRAILPLLETDAVQRNQAIITHLTEASELLLDPKEVRQLVMNIVRNAIEATPNGGIITIETYQEDDYTVLAISDQGPGIPDSIFSRLGTPFLTTKDNGTGLGLGICYSIAERHRAKIDVQTGSDGTTFFVRFPRQVR